ncbi:MAG TPA: ATP-binding protein [Ohtaekwangia sp.]
MPMALRFIVLIFLSSLFANNIQAQQYRFRQYRVEQGLPSDVVKAISQDSLGFLWIATDDGLVKYDGLRFTTYKSALHSQYAKSLFRTRDGRLFAIGDLDLIEIQNQVDTVIFRSVISGTRVQTDSTIGYPKSIYEDHQGNLWLAEPQSAVRFNGKSIERFDLGVENRSQVFIRSFSFFEDDDHRLYAVSYAGKFFRFDPKTSRFDPVKYNSPVPINNVSHAIFNYGKAWIASGQGVQEIYFKDGAIHGFKNAFPLPNASYLQFTKDSTLWVGTFDDNLFRIPSNKNFEALPYSFKGINSFYFSYEDDFWMATDKGLIMAQQNQFIIADPFSSTHFIEGIAYNPQKDHIYYCSKETLVELSGITTKGPGESKVIYNDPTSYFQSLHYGKRGLWASSTYEVLLFENDKLKQRWNFADEGDFVRDLFMDSGESLWISQAQNKNLITISEDLKVEYHKVPIANQSEINVVREGKKGVYAAANGINGYLFLKRPHETEFNNISLPINFKTQSDFNIVDLVVQENDILWMASTEGLLRYDHKTISRVDLGEPFTTSAVSSVEILNDRNILFSNSFGLFRYDPVTGDFWTYDENAGLPSNTITAHGIFIDSRERLWIGTSYGLGVSSETIMTDKQTPRPFCVEASVDGERQRFMNGLHVPHGSFINLRFATITFPENKINMQWRIENKDSVWRTLVNHELSLSDLPSGDHVVQVRSKKNTGLGWSDNLSMHVSVDKPFWQTPQFALLVMLGVVVIAWASYLISSHILKQRREYLQNLVEERTHDLKMANEELQIRNTELDRFVYSASHDLSAPLKSILGLINVARMDASAESHEQYLKMMERSVRKLEEFIEEVVSYSRNTRLPIKWEYCSFTSFAQNLLLDHQYSPHFNEIEFHIEDDLLQPMITDVTRLKIILNNLISNAIKFHFRDGKRKPFVKITLAGTLTHYILTVEDNGRGIEEQHVHHIFNMFYRATEEAQGSGLGLYILKESVTKLGGYVEAKSQFEIGSSFIICLPIPPKSLIHVNGEVTNSTVS